MRNCFGLSVILFLIGCAETCVVADDVRTYSAPQRIGSLECRDIRESSGLAVSRAAPGVYWTHNDSGDRPRLFAFDQQGKHLATAVVAGAKAVDWEDLATFSLGDRHYILVADVGDNRSRRKACQLYLIADHGAREKLTVKATILFRFENGPRDCESVGVDAVGRQIILVEKNWSPSANVYQLDLPSFQTAAQETANEETLVAKRIAKVRVPAATAMDISPDGQRAIILSYGNAYEYVRDSDESWEQAFRRPGREVRMPERKQGETICYDVQGQDLYLTSEQQPAPLFRVPASDGN